MKLLPLYSEMSRRRWPQKIIHTMQHADFALNEQNWRDLRLPRPDHAIRSDPYVGGHYSLGVKFDRLISLFEVIIPRIANPAVIVYGDCDTAVLGAWSAKRMGLKVIHVEAGLRCGDMGMKEEQNRVMVDSLSDVLLAPTYDACDNLCRSGFSADSISMAGNLMIDCMMKVKYPKNAVKKYTVLTLHRPANVDDAAHLKKILRVVNAHCRKVIFPVHPRAGSSLGGFNPKSYKNISFSEPMPYSRFINLLSRSRLLITDSGGCQEEAGVMGLPCITFRRSTERPVTLSLTNRLAPTFDHLRSYLKKLPDITKRIEPSELTGWNGDAAQRICEAIEYEYKATG